jgi:flagellar hook-length control protein FliK
MTTDLFFAPALPQKLPSSFQCDRTDTFSSAPDSKTDAPGWSKHDKPENFLTTLKRVSRDQNSNKGSRPPDSPAEVRSDKSDLHSENDQVTDQQPADDEILMELMSLLDADDSSLKDQSPVAAELKELLTLLEALGWTGESAERMVTAAGGLTNDNMTQPAEKNQNILAAFKQLIGDVQPTDLKPGNELSAGLEQLRQIISRALTADSSMSNPDIAQDGLNRDQSQVSVELARWAKGIIQGQVPATTLAPTAGEGNGTGKPVDLSTVPKEPVMVKSGEQFHHSSGSENPDKTDAPRLTPEIRVSAEGDGSARDPKGSDNLTAKNSENQMAGKIADGNRNVPVGNPLPSATGSQRSSGEPQQENSLTGESPPISKAADDATAGKDNSLKVDPVLNGDAGSKVVKSEGGTNDGGQWTSQGQTSERTVETPSTPKEAEGAQRELRTQTMDQIVRRALFQIKDGQQEARIDLKPDFLGHVRMQIITENQQVTVKILTEFGFVKDMIENNIQQLKADLQQQGLEVEKLDVSVSRDANGKNQQRENMEHAENQTSDDNSGDDGHNSGEGQRDQAERSARKADGLSTVDYFA